MDSTNKPNDLIRRYSVKAGSLLNPESLRFADGDNWLRNAIVLGLLVSVGCFAWFRTSASSDVWRAIDHIGLLIGLAAQTALMLRAAQWWKAQPAVALPPLDVALPLTIAPNAVPARTRRSMGLFVLMLA